MFDKFCKMIFAIDEAQSERSYGDIIGELPTEVISNIFRYLEPKDLENVAVVNRRWFSVCKGDIVLRRHIYEQLVKDREDRIQEFYNAAFNLDFVKHNSFRVLEHRNGRMSLEYKPFKYGIFNTGGFLKIKKRTQIHPLEQMFPKRKRDEYIQKEYFVKRINIRL